VIENALAEALALGEPVGCGEIYAGLPRRGGSGGVLAPGLTIAPVEKSPQTKSGTIPEASRAPQLKGCAAK
jgi:hypothetical protein